MHSTTSSIPLDKADLCVKCGLCLPHCPTYDLHRDEAESPRGRIMLMQGMATGMIEPDAKLQGHLDRCLGCRACETVCPAQVPYGELIDAARSALQNARPRRNTALRWLGPWLTHRGLRRIANQLLRLIQKLRLDQLACSIFGRQSSPARLVSLLPALEPAPPRGRYPATSASRGRVQLFTGCVSELVDGRCLNDSIELLNHCGFDVDVPGTQGCCGALHQHNGLTGEAQKLFRQNLEAFGKDDTPVLGTATGCTAMLSEYDLYAEDTNGFGRRVQDIHRFLLAHWPVSTTLPAHRATALLHEPCSLRNVLGGGDGVMRLLQQVPGLDVQPLAGNAQCCGAAGSMMLTDAAQADALLTPKLAAIREQSPRYLLSSNIGCAMHLAGGLRRAGLDIEVLHPVSLLARILRD